MKENNPTKTLCDDCREQVGLVCSEAYEQGLAS